MKKIVSLAAAFALVASTAQAQIDPANCATAPSCSVTTYATVTVNQILKLSISDTSTAINSPSEAMFDAGIQDVGTVLTVNVKSNKAFTVKAATSSNTWSGPYAKASTDLQIRTGAAASGTGTGLNTTGTTIVTSATGNGNSNTTVAYDIAWSYANDVPGTYTIPVVFTAAAP